MQSLILRPRVTRQRSCGPVPSDSISQMQMWAGGESGCCQLADGRSISSQE